MSGYTDYAQNKINDAVWRGQALGAPATAYFALITASRGERVNSATYAVNDTLVAKIGSKYSFYKCTVAGAAAATLPAAYTGSAGETIVDGAATFVEQTNAFGAGNFTEVSGGGYSRAGVATSMDNFAGTQGAGTKVASSGSDGSTSNNNEIAFPAPSGQWHPTNGAVVGAAVFDAATGGNAWSWGIGMVKSINSGDPAPKITVAGWTFKMGD